MKSCAVYATALLRPFFSSLFYSCCLSLCNITDYPEKVTVCANLQCMEEVGKRFESSGELIILTVTYSVDYDGYLPLYAGWIFEMFEKIRFHMLYFDISRMVLTASEAAQMDADGVMFTSMKYITDCSLCKNATDCPECAKYHVLKAVSFGFNPKRLAIVMVRGEYCTVVVRLIFPLRLFITVSSLYYKPVTNM